MGKIYSTQTDLSIQVKTGKNLTGITNIVLEARSPQGVLKSFTASIIDAPNGIVQYAVTSENDFKEVGKWTIWAKVTDAQGLVSIGEASKMIISKKGE